MKPQNPTSILVTTFVATASAHSWLHCTSFNNTDLLQWMRGNATSSNGKIILDAVMPEYTPLCAGYPRAKSNPGNWITESSTYIWAPGQNGDTHACHPDQRAPKQFLSSAEPGFPDHHAPAPMATARAGGRVQLMFGGNGHSRGSFGGVERGNAGRVKVFWPGGKEREIGDVGELTSDLLVQENGFSEESFAWPPDEKVTSPPLLMDKGNWQTVRLPECMEPGRHMMVWAWYIGGGKPSYTTCFDVMIEG